jgi:hypothetical protein
VVELVEGLLAPLFRDRMGEVLAQDNLAGGVLQLHMPPALGERLAHGVDDLPDDLEPHVAVGQFHRFEGLHQPDEHRAAHLDERRDQKGIVL